MYLFPPLSGSMTKSVVIVLGHDDDQPVGGQAGSCMFLTKPTRPPRSSNTQEPAWPHPLSEFCDLFCFTPLFVIEPWKHLHFCDEGALKRAVATIAEISLRARLTRVALGLLRPKAPRMGYRK